MRKLYLVIISVVLSVAIGELILRHYLQPSDYSFGYVFGKHLPPMPILPLDQRLDPEEAVLQRNTWYNQLVVEGKQITKGDLWGILRDDEILTFTSKENAVSTNGWWKSNNIGARSTADTQYHIPLDKIRVLIFGDSYAQSSRVPQNETIDYYMNANNSDLEVLNFGVDGYGMAQSYLRFQTIKDKIDFDQVILFFVPKADLERDINVNRYMGFNWYSSHAINIQPRYILEDDKLTLVLNPYKNLDELIEDNKGSISDKLRNHLRDYDAFYFEFWHETIPIWDDSILVKLIKRNIHDWKISRLKDSLINPESEALQISKKIFESMSDDVKKNNGEFLLVILPTLWDMWDFDGEPDFRKKWENMVSYICSGGINCLNLMPEFKTDTTFQLDTGYDKTHYGPKTNEFIAKKILLNLKN
jgi:hypothetical protein